MTPRCLCIIAILLAPELQGATLKVPSSKYKTIQAAVADAKPGDVIKISKGVYRQSVVIKNKDNIEVKAAKGAVIDADGADEGLSIINCTGIMVKKLAVRNADRDGVLVESSSDITLKNMNVTAVGNHCIRFRGVTDSLVEKCKVSHTEHDGIHIEGDAVVVSNNVVQHVLGDGIGIAGSNNTMVDNNLFDIGDDGCQVGDDILPTQFNLVMGNVVKKIGSTVGSNGIKVTTASDTTVMDNDVNNAGDVGISVEFSDDCVVQGNLVRNSGGSGIFLDLSVGTMLSQNTVENSAKDGICLRVGADDTTIAGVTIIDSKSNGLHIESANTSVDNSSAMNSGKFDLKDNGQNTVITNSDFPNVAP